jgi:fumarate hydratase class II
MQSMANAATSPTLAADLALTLVRVANDFRPSCVRAIHWASMRSVCPRFSRVRPSCLGKVNPVMAEMLDQAMFHVIGCDTTVALAAQAGQLELNVMMPFWRTTCSR